MLNQQALRKKLISTHNIKHITEAIELVSGIKFQKLIRSKEHFYFYAKKLTEMVQHLSLAIDGPSHPLFAVRPTKRVAVIVIASDRGLCGSYNANLLKQADLFLEKHLDSQLELILFGQKAVDHFKNSKWKIRKTYPNYVGKLSETTIKEWCHEFTQSFENGDIDELWVVHTHFINVLSRETKVEQLLPFKIENVHTHVENRNHYFFEPNPERIYNAIIPLSFFIKVQALFYESQAAELSARLVSMKAATKNADEMIEKLTLIKNKVRQSGITKEILEINAGAEGIK